MRTKQIATALSLALITAVAGCARMGEPDGGWYDDTPPKVVSASPADRAMNVKDKKVTIRFDEYIKVENATEKVVVSPPQIEPPEINASGKKIVVELNDSLKPNTTYTIDFSDAISDNNEGNPMGNYTYSFSTGERIDTFEVSGNVVDASNLEPVKGILVGLYDDSSDTAFTTKPLLRVSRTDSRGRFVIKGVAAGSYRAFALQDADGDYKYSQKSEMIAFSHDIFTPSCKPDIRQDTIWRDTLHIDSIARVPYIHYYPDNIVLRAFTAIQSNRYLVKTERTEPNKLSLYFSYGDTYLPLLRGLNFNADNAFVVEPSERNDTINYWLRDSSLINQDTLRYELTYRITDSTGVLVNQTDTIESLPRVTYEKRVKDLEKEMEKWQKEQDKAKKKGEPYDSIYPATALDIKVTVPATMSPDQNIRISTPAPLARLDTAAIHLYSKIDTLWYRSRFEIDTVPKRMREYVLRAEWRPDIEYSLEIDSAAFEDIYGLLSKPIKQGVKVQSNDKFGSLVVELTGVDTPTPPGAIIVQLLNSSDNAVKEATADNGIADFFYVPAGTYYMRAFVDSNGNGQWDTGDYDSDKQPEAVYYYPKTIECKEKWDITTRWNVSDTPANLQKPLAITKQKPEQEKKLRNRNADRARDLGIPLKK